MEILSIPQVIGYIAYVISLSAAMQKTDKKLFMLFSIANFTFSIHHFLLGNVSAFVSKIIIGVRMYLNQYFKGPWMAFPFAIIAIISGYFTYQSPYSVLPIISILLATFAAAYSGGIKLRVCLIIGCSLWLIHDIARHSFGGATEDATNMLLYTLTIRRMKKEQKKSLNESGSLSELKQNRAT